MRNDSFLNFIQFLFEILNFLNLSMKSIYEPILKTDPIENYVLSVNNQAFIKTVF